MKHFYKRKTGLKRALSLFTITIIVFGILWILNIRKREGVSTQKHKIEKILSTGDLILKKNIEYIFDRLNVDSINQQSLFHLMPEMNLGLFVFQSDTLIYWNENSVLLPDTALKFVGNRFLFSYNERWFLLRKEERGGLNVILVKELDKVEKILKNGYFLVQRKNCYENESSIHFGGKDSCLYLYRSNNLQNGMTVLSVQLILFFIVYILFLWIILDLYLLILSSVRRKYLYFLFFTIDLLLVFIADSYFQFPKFVWLTPFFLKSFSLFNFELSSGEYLLLLITVTFLINFFIKQLRNDPIKRGSLKLVLSFFIQSLILLVLYTIDAYLKSCKSTLLFNLISFSKEQIIALFFLAFSGFIIYKFVQLNVLFFIKEKRSKQLVNSVISSILVVLVAFIAGAPFDLVLIFLFVSTALLWCIGYLQNISEYLGIIGAIVILSVTALMVINVTAVDKERENQEFIANYLLQQSDPLFEYKLKSSVTHMLKDPFIDSILSIRDTILNENDIKNYLKENYFSQLSRYDFQITWCNKNVLLEVQPEQTLMPCKDYFKSIPGTNLDTDSCYQIKLAQSDFRTIYYIVTIKGCPSSKKYNSLVLEFVKEKFPAGVGYSGLLRPVKSAPLDLELYSFALYDKEKLLYKFGDFLYPSVTNELKHFGKNQLFKWSGYYHIIKSIDNNKKLIISRKTTSLLLIFFPFTLFFIVYLTFYMVYIAIVSYSRRRAGELLNYRNKIQLIYLLSFVSIFLILAGVSLYYINLGNRRTILNELEEKTHSIASELQNKFFINPDALYQSELILTNLSNFYFTDINLYDHAGFLISSSRPAIFDKKLQAPRINPKAYDAIKFRHYLYYVEKEQIGKQQFYSAYMPLYWENGDLAAFVNLPYFAKIKSLIQNRNELIISFLNLLIILVILIIIISYYVTRMITKPLFLLQKRIEETHLDEEIETIAWNRNDEIGKLIKAYNNMVNKLKESTELLKKSERESAWREMAQQIAHEIRNPLTPMKLNIQYLMKSKAENDPDFEEKLKSISETLISQIDALNNVASMFSDFSRTKKSTLGSVDLIEVISKSVMLFKTRRHVKIKTVWDRNAAFLVAGDAEDYLRIFNNLIKNSVQALNEKEGGEIVIEIRNSEKSVIVQVEDNGPGIDEPYMKKIFEPYFTTKSKGSGIGLAIVWNLVKELNGTITVHSEKGSGTRFTLTFPLYTKSG